jgi:hypothetical protein
MKIDAAASYGRECQTLDYYGESGLSVLGRIQSGTVLQLTLEVDGPDLPVLQ